MYAAGRPARLSARPGAIPGGGSDRSTSPAYQRENAAMAALSRTAASAFSVKDGSDASHMVEGYHNSWNAMGGRAWSGARGAVPAAMVPPAESPATPSRPASAPSS